MRLTLEHFLDLIDALPKGQSYDYVKVGANKIRLNSVDHTEQLVSATKVDANGSEKSANITTDNLLQFVSKVQENKPLHIESVWNGSGSARSAWEGLFAHTSEFYTYFSKGKKHLVWIPSRPHVIGIMQELSDDALSELSVVSYDLPHQIIYYGAPGTGKSNKIDEMTNDENRIRTTFHPDSDYSTFVGAYKPTMKKLPRYNPDDGAQIGEEEKITYEFVPQAFLQAYVTAWMRKSEGNEEPFYLVIEEINRGNCAQIFGDLFQLLDRNDEGASRYGICPDKDITRFLRKAFEGLNIEDERIKSGKEMRLLDNLYIWATMNTSDQSLFPIDSAFKRRWDWEYVPIADAGKGHVIEIGEKRYNWWTFISTINEKIDSITGSEDKKLGYWFVKPTAGSTVITAKQFVSKVLFYLWNDVYKDYADSDQSIFRTKDGKAPFTSFFGADSEQRLQEFMEYNKIDALTDEETKETQTETDE